MKFDRSVQAQFRFVVTSDAVDASYMVTTPGFSQLGSRDAIVSYIREQQFVYCTKFNREFGVNDFRPMNDDEAELFWTGQHKHSPPMSPGFSNENSSIRH